MQETRVRSLVWEDPLEKGMANHFSILAWSIPSTEEPGGPQFTGSQSQTRLSSNHFHFLSTSVGASLVAQSVKNLPVMREIQV